MMKSKEDIVQEFRIQSIQQAAMRVIARKGMAAATMNEIAKEAGIAKGTIYLYFRDRDELVEKTFETAIDELHARIDAASEGQQSFADKLRASLAAQIEFFHENREFFRLFISLRMPEGSAAQQRRQKKICQPKFESRIDRLAGLLRHGMERGEIREMDPRRLAIFIIEGSIAIVMRRVLEEEVPPAESDIDLIAGTILNGIVTKKRSSQ